MISTVVLLTGSVSSQITMEREIIDQIEWNHINMAMGQNLRYLFSRDYHLFKRLFKAVIIGCLV